MEKAKYASHQRAILQSFRLRKKVRQELACFKDSKLSSVLSKHVKIVHF